MARHQVIIHESMPGVHLHSLHLQAVHLEQSPLLAGGLTPDFRRSLSQAATAAEVANETPRRRGRSRSSRRAGNTPRREPPVHGHRGMFVANGGVSWVLSPAAHRTRGHTSNVVQSVPPTRRRWWRSRSPTPELPADAHARLPHNAPPLRPPTRRRRLSDSGVGTATSPEPLPQSPLAQNAMRNATLWQTLPEVYVPLPSQTDAAKGVPAATVQTHRGNALTLLSSAGSSGTPVGTPVAFEQAVGSVSLEESTCGTVTDTPPRSSTDSCNYLALPEPLSGSSSSPGGDSAQTASSAYPALESAAESGAASGFWKRLAGGPRRAPLRDVPALPFAALNAPPATATPRTPDSSATTATPDVPSAATSTTISHHLPTITKTPPPVPALYMAHLHAPPTMATPRTPDSSATTATPDPTISTGNSTDKAPLLNYADGLVSATQVPPLHITGPPATATPRTPDSSATTATPSPAFPVLPHSAGSPPQTFRSCTSAPPAAVVTTAPPSIHKVSPLAWLWARKGRPAAAEAPTAAFARQVVSVEFSPPADPTSAPKGAMIAEAGGGSGPPTPVSQTCARIAPPALDPLPSVPSECPINENSLAPSNLLPNPSRTMSTCLTDFTSSSPTKTCKEDHCAHESDLMQLSQQQHILANEPRTIRASPPDSLRTSPSSFSWIWPSFLQPTPNVVGSLKEAPASAASAVHSPPSTPSTPSLSVAADSGNAPTPSLFTAHSRENTSFIPGAAGYSTLELDKLEGKPHVQVPEAADQTSLSLEAATAPQSQDWSLDSPILGLSSAAAAAPQTPTPAEASGTSRTSGSSRGSSSSGNSGGTLWLLRLLSRSRSSSRRLVAAAAAPAAPPGMLPLSAAGPSSPVLRVAAEAASSPETDAAVAPSPSTPPSSQRTRSKRTWRKVGEGYSPVDEEISPSMEGGEHDAAESPPAIARRLFESEESGTCDDVNAPVDIGACSLGLGASGNYHATEIKALPVAEEHIVDATCNKSAFSQEPDKPRKLWDALVVSMQVAVVVILVILPAALVSWFALFPNPFKCCGSWVTRGPKLSKYQR
jgi:hypothetical protein